MASIGGESDLGLQLSLIGRDICKKSIFDNRVKFLNIKDAKDNTNKAYFKLKELMDARLN